VAAICVFCASSLRIPERYVELAGRVGTELAGRGHSLVSGGGSVSCMGEVARTARAGGARTVGVIPEPLVRLEVADQDADELVVTADMRTRKAEMDRRSDAFLVLPGGLGTLEETIEVWVSTVLSMHRKPIVLLDPDGVFDPFREQVQRWIELGFVRPEAADAVTWTRGVADAFDVVERLLSQPRATI
jgi:uncharacterized protein (TIGR00730 family)